MASWKIGSRSGVCARCERSFEDRERHVSTLFLNAEAELWREDLCAACWAPPEASESGDGDSRPAAEGEVSAEAAQAVETAEADASDGSEVAEVPEPVAAGSDAPQSLFWWFTHHRVEKKKKTLQLDLAALEQIFVGLEGREEEPVRELRYLLCLILMRKRRVKLEKLERGPAGESFIVKRPRRDERFQVFVFDFSPERLGELRAQLQALFDGADLEDGLKLPAQAAEEGAGASTEGATPSGAEAEGSEEVGDAEEAREAGEAAPEEPEEPGSQPAGSEPEPAAL